MAAGPRAPLRKATCCASCLPIWLKMPTYFVGDQALGLEARAVEGILDVLERQREHQDVGDLLRQVLAEGLLRGHGQHQRGRGEGAELERRRAEELAAIGDEAFGDLRIDAGQQAVLVECHFV